MPGRIIAKGPFQCKRILQWKKFPEGKDGSGKAPFRTGHPEEEDIQNEMQSKFLLRAKEKGICHGQQQSGNCESTAILVKCTGVKSSSGKQARK